ncbi:dynamin family protein [Dactylosporangium sp. AC04546]|uniref:dynamin family protein n=1 Tax=Dactylosporangium sp. AC04546 TaxID=2862460 RepID=UPI001EDEB8C8|nr:dynamin family protein [Dactylosporangium sp. AC04546]WVK82899.1 dynamin family protein [Dactylosporangium sp. AC04546]
MSALPRLHHRTRIHVLGAEMLGRHIVHRAGLDAAEWPGYRQLPDLRDRLGARPAPATLKIAVVAPMKAGKSSVVNALLGERLLPVRDMAMTVTPISVQIRSGVHEPRLLADEEAWLTVRSLAERLAKLGGGLLRLAGELPETLPVVTSLRTGAWYPFPLTVSGTRAVYDRLVFASDVCRLAVTAGLVTGRVPAMRVVTGPPPELAGPTRADACRIEFVDLPGPGEARLDATLSAAVAEQLRTSDGVLIILNYRHLQSVAQEALAEEIAGWRQDRPHAPVLVAVNHIDERDEQHGRSDESIVAATLRAGGLTGEYADRIVKTCAVWANVARSAGRLASGGRLTAAADEAAVLMRYAEPRAGAVRLAGVTTAELVAHADDLWHDSGLPGLLDQVADVVAGAPQTILLRAVADADRHLGRVLALLDGAGRLDPGLERTWRDQVQQLQADGTDLGDAIRASRSRG